MGTACTVNYKLVSGSKLLMLCVIGLIIMHRKGHEMTDTHQFMSPVVCLSRYSDEATTWTTERTWLDFQQWLRGLLFSRPPRQAWDTHNPTPPPLNGYLELFPRVESDRARSWRLALCRSEEWVALNLHYHTCLQGAVLNCANGIAYFFFAFNASEQKLVSCNFITSVSPHLQLAI